MQVKGSFISSGDSILHISIFAGMLPRKKLSCGLQWPYRATSYPAKVVTNYSLANIDKVKKVYVPLSLHNTLYRQTKVDSPTPTSSKVNIIPPVLKKTENQKGEGSVEVVEIMKFPIKVCF